MRSETDEVRNDSRAGQALQEGKTNDNEVGVVMMLGGEWGDMMQFAYVSDCCRLVQGGREAWRP